MSNEPMAREIEIKLRLAEPAALRGRLEALGATSRGTALELNQVFDFDDGRLREADCGLRLREARDEAHPNAQNATLAYKGPRDARGASGVKSRQEVELAIECAASMRAILAQLGLRPTVVFEKRRETWNLTGCVVTLDELPTLGWHVEIEGPSEEAVQEARRRLGLGQAPVVDQTFVELAARAGIAGPRGVRELRFTAR
jgi:predicted adenylyl cyclase CyaB